MASVIKDPNGLKRIQWSLGNGVRRTLRLGSVSMKQAEAVRVRIEQVLASASTGVLDAEASRWLEGLDDEMHEKLARLGLVEPRNSTKATLGGLLDAYFSTLSVKPGTRGTYEQTRVWLKDHFGGSCALTAITPLACDKWRQSMRDAKLADATIAKRIKTARQIFKQALRWKMLTENPFAEVKGGTTTNRSRMVFVSRADIQKVLDACPDNEWRLIIALSRFGGVRCPSEVMPLRWEDIDFDKGLIHVTSCKTEGYAGKDRRIIPMFPELREPLLTAFEQAEDRTDFVIARHRVPCGNMRTQMHRIIKRAGLTPWCKPFHNLRSSRQTELCEEHPLHVVCAWLGNSPTVAMAHYLQVRDQDYAKAIAGTSAPTATRAAAGSGGGVGAGSALAGNVGQPAANGASVAA